ncbi:MAG TPA: hypothetical protein VJC39_02340 [Candidatus Nanoarchaeia archaeon]|nr:hypothetical protein [Candidatus Nanoarchaeia archaeon]
MVNIIAWNQYKSLSYLPEPIQGYFVDEANILYYDLQDNKLKIVLVPASDPHYPGHKVRAAETLNPEWYSRLYSQIPYFQRNRSLRALERIIKKEDNAFSDKNCGCVSYKYNYDSIYRKLILDRLMGVMFTKDMK